MNQSSNVWSERHHHDPMASAPEDDDFSNFLEFGLDFSNFDGNNDDGHELTSDDTTAMDTSMDHSNGTNGIKELQHEQVFPGRVQAPQTQMGGFHMPGVIPMDASMQEQLIREHQFHVRQHATQHQSMQGQNVHRIPRIPPTPNSIELHGETARYYQNIDSNGQAIYEWHQRPKEDQVG
jgi:hypothetical protein